MTIKKYIHIATFFKWPFLLSTIVLIAYALIYQPDNLINLIGIILFIIGIYMGLDSLEDNSKMSRKEISFYKNQTNVNRLSRLISLSIISSIVISLFFMSLRFIFPSQSSNIFRNLFEVGLDCWALILGLLCVLKSTYDKREFAIKIDLESIPKD